MKLMRTLSRNGGIIDMSYDVYNNIKDTLAPLFIMHGLLGSRKNWKSTSKKISEGINPRRKIIALDARNHGDSPQSDEHSYAAIAKDIKALATKLNVKKPLLLGHCMGGRAMMYLSLQEPDFVERLIVVDVSPIGASPNRRIVIELMRTLSTMKLPTDASLTKTKKDIKKMLLEKNFNEKYVSFVVDTNLMQDSNGSLNWRCNVQALFDYYTKDLPFFPDIDKYTFKGPTLFIAGASSNFLPESHVPQIVRLFPKAEFSFIERAGHLVQVEKPKEFVEVCLNFLNRP